jgi:hypothetical protein
MSGFQLMKQTKKHIQFIHILFTNDWFQKWFTFNQPTERSDIPFTELTGIKNHQPLTQNVEHGTWNA